jgi:predicted nucleic acid-binding Zn ribbon protein
VIAQEKRAAVLPHLLESAEDFLLLICREDHSVICEGRCRAILGKCAKREMTRGHHLLIYMVVVVVVEVLKKPDLARLATPLFFILFFSIFITAT